MLVRPRRVTLRVNRPLITRNPRWPGARRPLPRVALAGTEDRHASEAARTGGVGLCGIEMLDQIGIDLEQRDDLARGGGH
jgi:hypothetical protein